MPRSSRSPRKDAQHNRAHILKVADDAFAREGVDASIEAIAKQATIGSATLYRHFPSKDALLVALLAPHYEALERNRDTIEGDACDAGRKLDRWLEVLGNWMLAYDGLPEPLRMAWSHTDSPLHTTCDALVTTTDHFLRAAQQEGQAKPSLHAQDMFLGALAVAWASGKSSAPADVRKVLLDAFREGWARSLG